MTLWFINVQLYYELAEPSNMSKISCRILFASLGVPTYVSCILMLLIAVDRYRSIIYPLRKRISTGVATILLLASVLLSVIAASPVAYFTDVQKVLLKLDSFEEEPYDGEKGAQSTSSEDAFPQYCVERWPDPESRLAYTILVFFGNFFTPLVCTAILYMNVGCWLARHSSHLQGGTPTDTGDSKHQGGQKRTSTFENVSPVPDSTDIPLHHFVSVETSCSPTNTRNNSQTRVLPPLALRIERRNRRTNRILVSIVICFAVCWTPWTLYSLYLECIAYSLTKMSRARLSVSDAGIGRPTGPEFNASALSTAIGKNLLRSQLQLKNANLKLTDIFLKLFALCSTCTNPFFYGWLNENIRVFLLCKFTGKESRERSFRTSLASGICNNFRKQDHIDLKSDKKISNDNGRTAKSNPVADDSPPKFLQQTDL
nr:unnamed protein product [Spirometra erinaceieuropaei]